MASWGISKISGVAKAVASSAWMSRFIIWPFIFCARGSRVSWSLWYMA